LAESLNQLKLVSNIWLRLAEILVLDLVELENSFAGRLRARPFYRNMQIIDEGLMLGADIALARQA
jgi:hypothetical protein